MIGLTPSPSLKAAPKIRPAVPADQQRIADLIFFETHVHRHLDWRNPLDWLGASPYWVMEKADRLQAVLACPTDPDSVAWIRLFVYVPHLSGSSAWSSLWTRARRQLAGRGGVTVAAIAVQRWFGTILAENGFRLTQHIVLLERGSQSLQLSGGLGVRVRDMTADDLPGVVEIDRLAFEPLWHNSFPALRLAFSQALYATVAEDTSGVVGYQMSTASSRGAHLARLAVRPEAQTHGLGAALVQDLILHVRNHEVSKITVNTQSDNRASLALYQKLGFRRTGEVYPVYTCWIE